MGISTLLFVLLAIEKYVIYMTTSGCMKETVLFLTNHCASSRWFEWIVSKTKLNSRLGVLIVRDLFENILRGQGFDEPVSVPPFLHMHCSIQILQYFIFIPPKTYNEQCNKCARSSQQVKKRQIAGLRSWCAREVKMENRSNANATKSATRRKCMRPNAHAHNAKRPRTVLVEPQISAHASVSVKPGGYLAKLASCGARRSDPRPLSII